MKNIQKTQDLRIGWFHRQFFWLYKDNIPIGYGRIRHYLNEKLLKDSGHVGYAISSSYRGNGYGNQFLKLLVNECINLEIKRIQIGTNKNNEKSNKIILRNGGKLFKETESKNIYIIETEE